MSEIDEQQIEAAVKAVAKEAAKEALTEWLDAKFAAFGKWSFMVFGAMVFAALIYFIAWINGWHK